MTRRGFTLLELVVVMIVIGILSSLAVSRFSSRTNDAYRTQTIRVQNTFRTNIAQQIGRYIQDPAKFTCINNDFDSDAFWFEFVLSSGGNPIISKNSKDSTRACNTTTPPTSLTVMGSSHTTCVNLLAAYGNIASDRIGTIATDRSSKSWLAFATPTPDATATPAVVGTVCNFYNSTSGNYFTYSLSTGAIGDVLSSSVTLPTS